MNGTGNQAPSRWGWFAVAFLLLVQWLLFRQSIEREGLGFLPEGFDQCAYLNASYQTYDVMMKSGFWAGLEWGFTHKNSSGLLLHNVAPLVYLLFGPSRLTSLSIHFVLFGLFQVLLVSVLVQRTRRWSLALFGMGLLSCAFAPYQWVGGLKDFRIDCAAFSLFGVLLCLLVRSGFFAHRSWSLAVGGAAALLVLFRFIAVTYLAGIMGTGLGVLLVVAFRRRTVPCEQARRQFVNALLAAAIASCVILPALVWHRRALWDKYVVNYVGAEGDSAIRQAEAGLITRADHYLYYLRSLWTTHTGPWFAALAAAGILTSVPALFRARKAGNLVEGSRAWPWLVTSLFIPWAILTITGSKSPVVGSILVPPLLWLALWPVVLVPRSRPVLEGVLATSAIIAALGVQLSAATERPEARRSDDASAHALIDLHDDLFARTRALNLSRPVVSTGAVHPYLSPWTVSTVCYERHGVFVDPVLALGSDIVAVDDATALTQAEASHFVILPNSAELTPSAYPFYESMKRLLPKLREYCRRHMELVGSYEAYGHQVELYERRTLGYRHESGGVVTSDGLTLTGARAVIRKAPRVRLKGRIDTRSLGGTPRVWARRAQTREEVPATITVDRNDYTIEFRVPEAWRAGDGELEVQLLFDRYFVPKAIGMNDDTRRIVCFTPTDIRLLE